MSARAFIPVADPSSVRTETVTSVSISVSKVAHTMTSPLSHTASSGADRETRTVDNERHIKYYALEIV